METARMHKSPTPSLQGRLPPEGREAAAAGGSMPGRFLPQAVSEAVSSLNDYVQQVNRTLQFSVDERSGQTIIRVMDAETREVIRQIPPEEVLALARHLGEGRGGLVEEHA
jgi:flagellar protein FlaG